MVSYKGAGLAAIFLLAGCADPDHVLFVTKTSLGVDFDAKPATFQVGYDRIEGYVGPRAEDGGVPPVIASIQSNGQIFGAEIRQVYATGSAATILSRETSPPPKDQDLSGERKLMFFGTTSNTGLKVGFTNNVPDSFVFGYKRKEFSFIPLGQRKSENGRIINTYPSVLASIDTAAQASGGTSGPRAGLDNAQFFATGVAADNLAHSGDVRRLFTSRAREAFKLYDDNIADQALAATDALKCYPNVRPGDLPVVWDDADVQELYFAPLPGETPTRDRLAQLATTAIDAQGQVADRAALTRANALYTDAISGSAGFSAGRAAGLRAHARVVCALSRR